MKAAVVELNLYHDEVLPTVVYALNQFGVEPDVYLPRRALIVIDGPAGEDGVRFGTLFIARPAPTATFLLDDALRDGEIDIANAWSRLAWVNVGGILDVGQGLLVGSLREG